MIFLDCSVQHISFLSFKCTEVLVRQHTFLFSPWLHTPQSGNRGYCPMNWDLPHDDMQIKCTASCFILLATVFIEEIIFLQNVGRENLLMTSNFIFNVKHAGLSTF